MYHTRNDVLGTLRRLTGLRDRPAATSHGNYRSSRDTAARRLRGEDARLLGLTAGHRGRRTSLIDYYPRG